MTDSTPNVKRWNRALDWCRERPLLGWYIGVLATADFLLHLAGR